MYRYFAYDCANTFPGIPEGPPKNHSDVICTRKYSDVAPSTGGEVGRRPETISNLYSSSTKSSRRTSALKIHIRKRSPISSKSPICASTSRNSILSETTFLIIGRRSTRSTIMASTKSSFEAHARAMGMPRGVLPSEMRASEVLISLIW